MQRLRCFTFLALFFLASAAAALRIGAATPSERPWSHGQLRVSANHRFLQHDDGTPFFLQGETAWLMPQKLDRQEVQYYLDRCRKAGYNMAQVQVLNDVPSVNVYGQLSHVDGWNMATVDRKGVYGYWDHLDYIVTQAERQGIYIGLVAIWGSQVKAGRISEAEARAYGTFLANRYKNRPNIIWVMGGDIQGDIHPEVWTALATAIKAVDQNHLMTYHPRGRYTSAQFWPQADWLDFHSFQSGHRRYGQRMGNKVYPIPDNTEEDSWMYVDSTWTRPLKPVIDDEPVYEDIPQGLHDPQEPLWQACDVRRYAYWSVFAGSCGHTYGHNSIMQFFKPGQSSGYGDPRMMKPWYVAMEDPGFNQMHILKELMLTLPYFERVPDQTVIVENGERYDRLIATRGTDYLLCYNYTGRTMRLDLTKISGERKRIWWLDAATGRLTYLGEHPSKVFTFQQRKHTDGVEDGVLIAIDARKNYLSQDQKAISDMSMAGQARDLNE